MKQRRSICEREMSLRVRGRGNESPTGEKVIMLQKAKGTAF